MDKPWNAEEQAFWDKAALKGLSVFIKAAVDGTVDDCGLREAASDVGYYADALLAERRKRTEPNDATS